MRNNNAIDLMELIKYSSPALLQQHQTPPPAPTPQHTCCFNNKHFNCPCLACMLLLPQAPPSTAAAAADSNGAVVES
jgi:hypothetical protein